MERTKRQNPIPLLEDWGGGLTAIHFNFSETDILGVDGGTHKQYEADELVLSASITRDSIIRALMRDKYPLIDNEIAIINNKDIDEAHSQTYSDYQNYRTWAKGVADSLCVNK